MLLHRARVNWLVDFIVTAFMVFFIAFCIVLAVIAGLILAMMFFAAPVFAADAAPSTTVDFSPLLSELVQLAALILTALVAWGIAQLQSVLRKKWGLQVDDAQRQLLEDTIDHAIAYGAAKAKELAAKDGTVDVGNATLKLAADYANAHAPDALAHFGVTDEQLAKKIVAQLPQPAA